MKQESKYNIEYININGINYKCIPYNNITYVQLKKEFNDYLDSLDAEIYNRALERYGKTFSLKYFSDLMEATFLNEEGISKLNHHIEYFKNAVKEVVQERIAELATNYLCNKSNNLLKQSLNSVKECINFYELNGLTDEQEFLDWEDELNELSCKEHPECLHDWLNYKYTKGCQLEPIHE